MKSRKFKKFLFALTVTSALFGTSPLFGQAEMISGPTLSARIFSPIFSLYDSGGIITGTTLVAGPTLVASVNIPRGGSGGGAPHSSGGGGTPSSQDNQVSNTETASDDTNAPDDTDTTKVTEPSTPTTTSEPEPAVGDASRPHEPSGFSLVTHRTFAEKSEDGWSANPDKEFTITRDNTAPVSPPSVGQALFPRGLRGGYEPIATQINIDNKSIRRLYVSFWLKISDNWQSHRIVNKVLYIWIHNQPVVMVTFIPQGGNLYPEIRVQSTPDDHDGSANYALNGTKVEVKPGEWQHWEVLLVANTNKDYNAEAYWWLDENLVGSRTGMRFGTSDSTWDKIAWRPVWGGLRETVSEDQYMWMDDLYASGR